MSKSTQERIRTLRTALTLGQADFADEIGVSHSLMSKIEGGLTPITRKVLVSIAERWECPIEWLEKGKGTMAYNAHATKKSNNLYQDALYVELKEQATTWKQKFEEATAMLYKVIGNSNLGKLTVRDFAARVKNNRVSRTKVLAGK